MSYKNCFQYSGVLLIKLIKENALPSAKYLCIISLWGFFIIRAMSWPFLILYIANFIDERK